MKIDNIPNAHDRLDIWAQMMSLANAMLLFCDRWWEIDAGIRAENERRLGAPAQIKPVDKISD